MNDQAVLYALSTLAQTCAALAAFVGAVGLYKLQSLFGEHARNEQTIRGLLAGHTLGMASVPVLPLDQIIEVARANVVGQSTAPRGVVDSLRNALTKWDGFAGRHRHATRTLFILEAWNLFVIGLSLVGFNYIPLLVSSPWTFWALWATAIGTVGVTGYCVYAWTRG